MLSLVSLCPAVFLGDPSLKMQFFKYVPIPSRSTFEYQSGHDYATKLLVKFGKILGLWCWNWEFLFPTARIRPPYQILPHVTTLACDSKLDIKLLHTFALV
jgi:hypothetical protein